MEDIFDGLDLDLDLGVTTSVSEPTTPVATGTTQPATPIEIPKASAVYVNNVDIDALAKSGAIKLLTIGNELNMMFVEREEVIKNALRALAIGQSMLLLGPPGTGKSNLTEELCSRIQGGTFFQWLLNRTSDPAEILGPYSLKAMEQDRFLRVTTGKLPEAHIVFLDEIFKCNEPTLNIMLPLINEKKFYNDGVAVPVPLISMFAASNELPEDESLDALYDRLIFRMWIDYIGDQSNRQKMFEGYLSKRNGASALNARTTITLDEIQALQEKSKEVTINSTVLKNFITLLNVLSKKGIVVSDRRQNECLKVLQGNAILNGRSAVTLDDLEALTYILWKDKSDIDLIREEINKIANPYDDKLAEYTRKFNEIKADLESITDDTEKCRKSIEAKGSFESITKRLATLIKNATKAGKDTSAMTKLRENIISYNQEIMQASLGINIPGVDDLF